MKNQNAALLLTPNLKPSNSFEKDHQFPKDLVQQETQYQKDPYK